MKNPLMHIWMRFAASRVGRSIFRVGLPHSNLGRAQAMVSSFFLHLHPAKVNRRSLKFTTTMGLGLISLYLFLILTFTGVLLMFFYVPHPQQAYANMKDLEFVVSAGSLLRNMHRWAAHLMVLAVFLHMLRVFYTGAYKSPREFNWVVGISLLLLTLGLSFTGYLLPWDQLAFWAITVGTNIAGYAPLMGERIQFILLGGNSVDDASLLRFYVLHVIIFPGILLFMLAIHLWRVRKDGGLARPNEAAVSVLEMDEPSLPGNKSYGLMGLARGSTSAVGIDPEDEVLAWPNLLFREMLLFMATLIVVLLMAIFWNAPLEEIANPIHPPNPAKAPWYFLGLQELVAYSAFVGGVVVPTLLLVALVALPYIDRNPEGVGVWFSRERRVAITVFTACVLTALVLTVIGTYFRGANWDWVWPWLEQTPAGH